MTSAPMSASISVQVGPAMTCVRSTTFNPDRGPIVSPAISWSYFVLRLLAGRDPAGPHHPPARSSPFAVDTKNAVARGSQGRAPRRACVVVANPRTARRKASAQGRKETVRPLRGAGGARRRIGLSAHLGAATARNRSVASQHGRTLSRARSTVVLSLQPADP